MAFQAFNFGKQLGLVGYIERLSTSIPTHHSSSTNQLGSAIGLSAMSDSTCDRAATGAGMRLLAKKDCPVPDEEHPICIQSVYVSQGRELPNGECEIFIKICYIYSYQYLVKAREDSNQTSISVILGNSHEYNDGARLDSFSVEGFIHPTLNGNGGDIDEWTSSFSIILGPDANFDTIFIGGTWWPSQVVWDQISFDSLKCDHSSNSESDKEVVLGKMGHNCKTCYFWLENITTLNGWIIEVRNRFGKVVHTEIEPRRPTSGTAAYISLPCSDLYNGASVSITDYKTGKFKMITIPPYWHVDSSLKRGNHSGTVRKWM